MPPASRLAARLADLSHAQLVEIAAAGCEASTQVKNRADALLAAHKPLAQWAVEGVLLSSDLVPHLLAPLQLEDGAAAAVCSRWAEGWTATSEGRRRLRKVALEFPQELLGERSLHMAVVPGGDAQLVVRCGTTVHILDRNMSSVGTSFELWSFHGDLAASEPFLYMNEENKQVRCLTHDGAEVAYYEEPGKRICYPTLAPGGLLFCVLYEEGDDSSQDEIVALDAQTLQPRHRFGQTMLDDAAGIAVVGEELFVCDCGNDRLQVFSLAGEHRRSITGEWNRPAGLCFVKDRLYLVEEADEEDEEGELAYPLQGRRIFVLSLQGDILQVYMHPVEGQIFKDVLCCFDGKLLAPILYKDYDDPRNERFGEGGLLENVGVVALFGV